MYPLEHPLAGVLVSYAYSSDDVVSKLILPPLFACFGLEKEGSPRKMEGSKEGREGGFENPARQLPCMKLPRSKLPSWRPRYSLRICGDGKCVDDLPLRIGEVGKARGRRSVLPMRLNF